MFKNYTYYFTALFTILFFPAKDSNYLFFDFDNQIDFNSLTFFICFTLLFI